MKKLVLEAEPVIRRLEIVVEARVEEAVAKRLLAVKIPRRPVLALIWVVEAMLPT